MKTALLIVCIYLFSVTPRAQSIEFRVKVVNQKAEALPGSSVKIIHNSDTSISNSGTTNKDGQASFSLPAGQYIINISATGYLPLERGITVNSKTSLLSFTLDHHVKSMDEVIVTARRPLMRQEDDKTIIDPEPLAAISTNGYEVIEKTPGLFVDQDGNIYISSMSPASVQINGREMKLSSADVATILKSLPPGAITRIEIVRTPSAKYDASGSGGIVNVVLKKGVKIGLTGSVHAGFQQGIYANKFLGLNINNNAGKRNSYLNLNASRRNSYEKIITDRVFSDSLLSQYALTKYPGTSVFAGYGLGFELNEKWQLNYDGRSSINFIRNYTTNRSILSSLLTNEISRDNFNQVWNNGHSFFNSNGFSLKYKMDTLGSEWSSDAAYTYSYNNTAQQFLAENLFPIEPGGSGNGDIDNNRNYFTAQSDLKKKFAGQWTVETGLKTSILGFKNKAVYFRVKSGNSFEDVARTNTFHYEENINSFYLQGSKTVKTVVIKAGGRIENTNMMGRQLIPSDTSFIIHRTDLFPYIYLSRKVMSIAGYELRGYLVFRRSISRPAYEQLNPFPRYIDEFLTEVGNPALRPQFTTNYEANVSVDERPILAIGVNQTKDIFNTVIYQSDTSQSQAYRTTDNLGTNKEIYFRALGALPPGGKYFFVLGTQYNHNFYQGLYENKPLSFKRGTWTFFTYHSLKLDKRSQLTVNGFMRLKGQQQFYELSPFGSLHTSINRQFFKQKLIITLSLNDVFATNKNDFTLNQGSVNASGTRSADTRRFGINIRYNFGMKKKEESNNEFTPDAERSN